MRPDIEIIRSSFSVGQHLFELEPQAAEDIRDLQRKPLPVIQSEEQVCMHQTPLPQEEFCIPTGAPLQCAVL
jgi:hypothetical protein